MTTTEINSYNRNILPPFIPKTTGQSAPDLYKYYITFTSSDTSFVQFKVANKAVNLRSYTYNKFRIFGITHPEELNEILILLARGYQDGRAQLMQELKDYRSIYGFNGVKAWLIGKVESRNKGKFYLGTHNANRIVSEHDPETIHRIGFENALYYEAWTEIFKMPREFNEAFRRINIELYKKKSNNVSSTLYPKRYVKNINQPDNIQGAVDLYENCKILLHFLEREIVPILPNFGDREEDFSIEMSPRCAEDFKEFCTEFLKEAANNHEKGLVERNKKFYFETILLALGCIQILKKPELHEYDMVEFGVFEDENWFLLMFNCLENTVDSVKSNYPFIFDLQDPGRKEPIPPEGKAVQIKVKQIALIHIYEGIQISRKNASEIAAKYGYRSKSSGEGLFQDYSLFLSKATRIGEPTECTKKTLNNKIRLFESTLDYLSEKAKQKATDELQILRKRLSKATL
jgi:hypothetical protein